MRDIDRWPEKKSELGLDCLDGLKRVVIMEKLCSSCRDNHVVLMSEGIRYCAGNPDIEVELYSDCDPSGVRQRC